MNKNIYNNKYFASLLVDKLDAATASFLKKIKT